MDGVIAKFIARLGAGTPGVRLQQLGGGLEAGVVAAELQSVAQDSALPRRFVVKQMHGWNRRELDVYPLLQTSLERPPIARVLGTERDDACGYLFLEEVCAGAWPWRETRLAARVLQELARVHSAALLGASPAWDYEAELHVSAVETLHVAERTHASGLRVWRRQGDLRRVVTALPAIRRYLLDGERCLIHGDVHPGNVLVRSATTEPHIVFIDWARARVGSPFEDVACWLQSLGCWEPQARRRHDTLLCAYLRARGGMHVSKSVRQQYWLAAATNALSGAIRYHLSALGDAQSNDHARWHSLVALRGATRVMRAASMIVRDLRLATASG